MCERFPGAWQELEFSDVPVDIDRSKIFWISTIPRHLRHKSPRRRVRRRRALNPLHNPRPGSLLRRVQRQSRCFPNPAAIEVYSKAAHYLFDEVRSTVHPEYKSRRPNRTPLESPDECVPLPRRKALNFFDPASNIPVRSEEHTSELQSQFHLVCRLLLEKK